MENIASHIPSPKHVRGIQVKRNRRTVFGSPIDAGAPGLFARQEGDTALVPGPSGGGPWHGLGHTRSSSRPSFNSVESAASRRGSREILRSARFFPLGSRGWCRVFLRARSFFLSWILVDLPWKGIHFCPRPFRRDAAAGSWRRRDHRASRSRAFPRVRSSPHLALLVADILATQDRCASSVICRSYRVRLRWIARLIWIQKPRSAPLPLSLPLSL